MRTMWVAFVICPVLVVGRVFAQTTDTVTSVNASLLASECTDPTTINYYPPPPAPHASSFPAYYYCLAAFELYTRDNGLDDPGTGLAELLAARLPPAPPRNWDAAKFYPQATAQMEELLSNATRVNTTDRGLIEKQFKLAGAAIQGLFDSDLDSLRKVQAEIAVNPYRALYMLLCWANSGTPANCTVVGVAPPPVQPGPAGAVSRLVADMPDGVPPAPPLVPSAPPPPAAPAPFTMTPNPGAIKRMETYRTCFNADRTRFLKLVTDHFK